MQITFSIDGREIVKNFGYDVQLIRPGTFVYLGGGDADTQTHSFRGTVHKVGMDFFFTFFTQFADLYLTALKETSWSSRSRLNPTRTKTTLPCCIIVT